MNVEEMGKIIRDTKSCASCLQQHGVDDYCDNKTDAGADKTCRSGCRLDNKPLAFWACRHGCAWRATVAVALGQGRLEEHVPLVETVRTKDSSILIKYDTGSSMTLIKRETLVKLRKSEYQLGKKRMILIQNHTGAALEREMMQEITINLNNNKISGFVTNGQLGTIDKLDVQVPKQWLTKTGYNRVHIEEEPIDVLAGSTLGSLYPNQVGNYEGLKLFRSVITGQCIMFGLKSETGGHEETSKEYKEENPDEKGKENKNNKEEEDRRGKVLDPVTRDCCVDDGSPMLDNKNNLIEYRDTVPPVLQQDKFKIEGFEFVQNQGKEEENGNKGTWGDKRENGLENKDKEDYIKEVDAEVHRTVDNKNEDQEKDQEGEDQTWEPGDPTVGQAGAPREVTEAQERVILGRVVEVYRDKTGAKFSAMLEYRRSIGGKMIQVKRHLNELARFMSKDEIEFEDGEEDDANWRPRDLAQGRVATPANVVEVKDAIEDEAESG